MVVHDIEIEFRLINGFTSSTGIVYNIVGKGGVITGEKHLHPQQEEIVEGGAVITQPSADSEESIVQSSQDSLEESSEAPTPMRPSCFRPAHIYDHSRGGPIRLAPNATSTHAP